MNVLWILAHPEPRSLNGYLAAEGQRALRTEGHQVEESDLYAMGWNPVVDAAGYAHHPAERFQVAAAAKQAYESGALSADIRVEPEKINRADTLVVQFPMCWFGMPAILKGWFDRVWHQGFAYGLRGPNGEWMGYGDGFLAGKRAMAVVTSGGPAWFYGERGIHGAVDELLFPLQHGTLFYAGAEVLPPMLNSGADRFMPEEGQASARERGRHGGRPKVVDDGMADYARNLRAEGVSVPQIAQKLVITSGKNKGQRPSVATVYRILAEDDAADGPT